MVFAMVTFGSSTGLNLCVCLLWKILTTTALKNLIITVSFFYQCLGFHSEGSALHSFSILKKSEKQSQTFLQAVMFLIPHMSWIIKNCLGVKRCHKITFNDIHITLSRLRNPHKAAFLHLLMKAIVHEFMTKT